MREFCVFLVLLIACFVLCSVLFWPVRFLTKVERREGKMVRARARERGGGKLDCDEEKWQEFSWKGKETILRSCTRARARA